MHVTIDPSDVNYKTQLYMCVENNDTRHVTIDPSDVNYKTQLYMYAENNDTLFKHDATSNQSHDAEQNERPDMTSYATNHMTRGTKGAMTLETMKKSPRAESNQLDSDKTTIASLAAANLSGSSAGCLQCGSFQSGRE